MKARTKITRSVKAVSKVISVLLMIAIAVAAALIAYAWIMGYMGRTTTTTGKAIQIQSVANPATRGSWLIIYVQNVGQSQVQLRQDASVYVNDVLHKITESPSGTPTTTGQLLPIPVGQTRELVIDYWYIPGTTLRIKVVTIEGTFMEIIIHGSATSEGSTPPGTQYTLTVNVDGTGSITKNPNKAKYNPGDTVQLIPSTSVGWQFDHWSGDLTGSANPGNIIMNSEKSVTATFTQKEYTLTITQNGQGTITKTPDQPTYHLGDQVTLNAEPEAGWFFAGWTGDKTSSNPQITLTIDETPQITATFTQTQFSLTVTINPTNGGSVNQNPLGPDYQQNEIVTLTANPATGFTFAGWSGDVTGTTNPAQIKITKNHIVTANFEKIPVTLELNANPTYGGSISASQTGTYYYGDTIQLTAISNTGFSFNSWSGDLTGIANPTWITLDGNKEVTANFVQNEYGLIIHIAGSGTVTRSPDQATYHYGDRVTLTATPEEGWSFAGWTGDVTSSSQQVVITIDETPEVTATFTQSQFSLTVTSNPEGSGSVTKSPAGPAYTYGTVVTLTASANPGFRFTGWSGAISGTTNPGQVTITGNMLVTANFERIPVTLTLNVNPSGAGIATSSPGGQYYYGDTAQLIATPSAGYSFDKWTGDLTSSSNPATITLNGDKTVTANFNQIEYTLKINIVGNGNVGKSPIQATYHYGDEVELTATPAANWNFAGWSGAVTGTSTKVTVTIFDNTAVTATFTEVYYSLTVTPYPEGSGTVSKNPAGPTYTYGTVVTLTASAANGFHFVSWSGHLTGTANPAQITITGNMIVTANFASDLVTLTLNVNPAGAGTITPSRAGPYYYGDTIQLTATPAAGYVFDRWTGDITGTSNPTTITLNGNKIVTANFAFGTGFDGSPWDQGWNDWANPPWHRAIGEGYLGTNAAGSSSSDDGPFSSDAIDTRSANTITITFKWKVQGTLSASDLKVLYCYIRNPYSGGNSRDFYLLDEIGQPNDVSDAINLGNSWYQLTITLTRTSHPNAFSQYFRLRFESNLSSGERVWVDDVKIALTS